MFGLMRYEPLQTVPGELRLHRLHYCGTCKAILHQYGQRARLALNYDVVFLAEVLSHFHRDINPSQNWMQFRMGSGCFNDPFHQQPLPYSLSYAAAVNIFLASVKLSDNISDERGSRKWAWRFSKNLLRADIRKAAEALAATGMEVQILEKSIAEHQRRETEAVPDFPSSSALLDYYAGATAETVGLIYQHGVKAQPSAAHSLYNLGFRFGKLVYILDAFLDYPGDLKEKRFNPLRILWKEQMPDRLQVQDMEKRIEETRQEVAEAIMELGLPENQEIQFCERLKTRVRFQVSTAPIHLYFAREQLKNVLQYASPVKKMKKLAVSVSNEQSRDRLLQKPGTGRKLTGALLIFLGLLFILIALLLSV